MSAGSLYRRLLGPDFDRLPPVLRHFHDTADEARGEGVVDVRVAPRPWGRALARALGLPRPGDNVPVTVRVRAIEDREIWDRTFGRDRLRSVQWTQGGRLLERVGALTFGFDVSADETGMRFRFASLAAFGIRVPHRLSIQVDADVAGFATGWHVHVVIRAPGSQVVTSYEGRIEPLAST